MYLTGFGLAFMAFVTIYLGQDVWAILPAAASVFILGCALGASLKRDQ